MHDIYFIYIYMFYILYVYMSKGPNYLLEEMDTGRLGRPPIG